MTKPLVPSMNDWGAYDFRQVGTFVTQWRASDGTHDGIEERYIWECRFCYCLTHSPEDHFRMHAGTDEHPEIPWGTEPKVER